MATKKIIYGDDKPEMREALARAVRLRGLEIDLASTPEELLRMARTNSYHAVITDLEYTPEGREGYDILKQLRTLPTLKILYSGINGFEYLAEALEAGADYAVLNKNESALIKLLDEKLKGGDEK